MTTPKLNNCAHVFNALKGSFYIVDSSGSVVYAHQSLERKTGFSIGEIIGKKPGELWGGNMDTRFYKRMWRTIKKRKDTFISDVENIKKDTTRQVDRLRIAPIKDKGKEVEYFLEIQPAPGHNQDEFEDEFQKIFKGKKEHSAELLEWIQKRMAGSENDKHTDTIKSTIQDHKTLSDILFNTFIFPTQQQYKEREEDRELILKAQLDPEQFQLLYVRYYQKILTYFLRRLNHSKEVSEELAQETFFKAFQYLPDFKISNASYKTYLLRIAHNLLVNYYKTKKTVSLEDLDSQLIQTRMDYERIIIKNIVSDSLLKLAKKDQQIINMKYTQGLSIREIATILQKTENAVKLQLSRARKKMKKILSRSEGRAGISKL